ncbi:MAG: fused MFS/spermidine synthase [Flavobacteriaceae bacterium]|nr:fused MFS/spermidine synthase [Flavobacteriaceae bacterium]
MRFKKLISYLYPIIIEKLPSENSDTLEVTLVNGKVIIDSKNTNYSYGSLQKVLKEGLQHIGKDRLEKFKNVLILGVAGGSVIDTLRNDIKIHQNITGIEIDSQIIQLANKYYQLESYKDLELIQMDAFEYVRTTTEHFDFIVIDIFNDNSMPDALFEKKFWDDVYNILNENGLCLFNSMKTLNRIIVKNQFVTEIFNELFSEVIPINSRNKYNTLFILDK